MRNYKFYGTKNGRMPMTMPKAADFGDSKYDSVAMFYASEGVPVAVLCSVALTPMPWCVLKGTSTVFFSTYNDAISYCRRRGYKLIEKGGK